MENQSFDGKPVIDLKADGSTYYFQLKALPERTGSLQNSFLEITPQIKYIFSATAGKEPELVKGWFERQSLILLPPFYQN